MKEVFKYVLNKYTLRMSDTSIIQLPVGARVLKIEEKNGSDGVLYIWAVVDLDEKLTEPRKFRIAEVYRRKKKHKKVIEE